MLKGDTVYSFEFRSVYFRVLSK